MKYEFEKKFEKLCEDTIYRFQSGGFLSGDVVKFKNNVLAHARIKDLAEQYKDVIKNAMESGLNIRLSSIKSIRPSTSQNYDGYGVDSPADLFCDVVVEHAPGCWQTPITVPIEVLERVDTGINLAPVPDSLKRQSQSTKPSEITANDAERTNTKKHTVLANSPKPTDGRSGIKAPQAYKESLETSRTYKNRSFNDLLRAYHENKKNIGKVNYQMNLPDSKPGVPTFCHNLHLPHEFRPDGVCHICAFEENVDHSSRPKVSQAYKESLETVYESLIKKN